MAKANLKIDSESVEDFRVACEAEDVTVDVVKKYGIVTKAEVSFRKPDQLFNLGYHVAKLEESEEE